MAVLRRTMGSTTPFTESQKDHDGPKMGRLGYLGQLGPKEAIGLLKKPCDWREEPQIPSQISAVLMLGTATLLDRTQEGGEKLCYVSVIAQAECEVKQEFSPTCSEGPFCIRNDYRSSPDHNNVARTTGRGEYHARRPTCGGPRKRRKKQRRRGERAGEGDGEGQRQRKSSGVPEQESSCLSLVQVQEESELSDTYITPRSSGVQETEVPDLSCVSKCDHRYEPHAPNNITNVPSLWQSRQINKVPCQALPSLNLSEDAQESLPESPQCSVWGCELAVRCMRGNVCKGEKQHMKLFFQDVKKEACSQGDEVEQESVGTNEGILLHESLKPMNSEYREGREYTVINHIQNGSFGEVYKVRDNSTGFQCAAKKILMDNFNSEEVGSWSALNSPRIVQLLGAVREGGFVTLFMDLKAGSLGQLLKDRGRLPEDRALHYHSQVLEALQHLEKRRVLHRDIKADNVLLSSDGEDAFLCDFGYSERLDPRGKNQKVIAGEGFQGTETHMAPEVVRGEPCSTKADVWSSCCMVLHMLNGCHPWTRYYTHPLCLKIANEPPPLKEIPSSCHPFTAEVIRAGLEKDPITRDSAAELKEKVHKALYAVGGVTSPVKGPYQEPARAEPKEENCVNSKPAESLPEPSGPTPLQEKSSGVVLEWVSPWRKNALEEEEESDSASLSPRPLFSLPVCSPVPQKQELAQWPSTASEQEQLQRDFFMHSLSQPYSPELQEQLLICLSSECYSHWDPGDKDSGRWSLSFRDDISSGVSSYNSQTDIFSMDSWLGPSSEPPSCFNGVDVLIKDFTGEWLRIRDAPKVQVGHIAKGISEQISESMFSLVSEDGDPVPCDEEVSVSEKKLLCTPAPDCSPHWTWRIREGELEFRD
ncbi:mitogen-activated protein kinase kinase kinase 14 isoform X1 [Amia ocellicauda]|uniref:mitogen-activated protein kinase kinase kinase 14 isoform X1 n=1 Tax=Amia ocellicauda TaxID=2972642 RepID=UPI003464B09A